MNRQKWFRKLFRFSKDIKSQSLKIACRRSCWLRGHTTFSLEKEVFIILHYCYIGRVNTSKYLFLPNCAFKICEKPSKLTQNCMCSHGHVRVVNDYFSTCQMFFLRILREYPCRNKLFLKTVFVSSYGAQVKYFKPKKWSKILWHCPFKFGQFRSMPVVNLFPGRFEKVSLITLTADLLFNLNNEQESKQVSMLILKFFGWWWWSGFFGWQT